MKFDDQLFLFEDWLNFTPVTWIVCLLRRCSGRTASSLDTVTQGAQHWTVSSAASKWTTRRSTSGPTSSQHGEFCLVSFHSHQTWTSLVIFMIKARGKVNICQRSSCVNTTEFLRITESQRFNLENSHSAGEKNRQVGKCGGYIWKAHRMSERSSDIAN